LPEIVCDTSPLQYLHQLGLLHLLPALGTPIVIPPAVEHELLTGKTLGIDLPDLSELNWLSVRPLLNRPAVPLVHDLGPGETEVLMLGLESPGAVLILDDALARRIAATLEIPFTGTLGVLMDGKKAGLIPAIRPLIDQLQALRFRVSTGTRSAVLARAGEND
jgi:predicted nucleic acid-binding protein